MNNHPKVPFTVNKWVYVLNSISILFIISSNIYLIIVYPKLPGTIPTHFNVLNIADDWGSKLTVFISSGIALVLFIGLYFLSKFPHVYNYPVVITEENASRIYSTANLFMTILNLEIVLIFSLASIDIKGQLLGIWFVFVVFGVPLLTVAAFAIKVGRLK